MISWPRWRPGIQHEISDRGPKIGGGDALIRTVSSLVAGIALIVATVLLFRNPTPGLLLGYFGAVGALGRLQWSRQVTRAGRLSKHDRDLIASLRSELPFDPHIAFLRDHDFGASFALVRVAKLDDFIFQWSDAAHEFDNKALELGRKRLMEAFGKFSATVGQNTWTFESGLQTVRGAPNEDPEEWERRAKELNELSSAAANAHQSLEREARRVQAARSLGELLVIGLGALLLALPALAFLLSEMQTTSTLRLQVTQASARLAVVSDSLSHRLTETESALQRVQREVRHADSTRTAHIEYLGSLYERGDDLRRACLAGPPPTGLIAKWETEAARRLGEFGRDYRATFQSPPGGITIGFDGASKEQVAAWNFVNRRMIALGEALRGIRASTRP